ncbi:helix-turn-helix transcriptional regulator [Vitiosangium sp. GDMCC 1.1324]|uniref:helix-turn-helix transcriptional regulator n=1 Tax=Vitiosangium sp. (strain GDMCC 1.1324) TaxID=2138576 RepID=UPI000D356D98|nr:helix-turn-helix domain-containing protein [Vitiosangium sp. GDMCC 1.1324]PTL80617.1 transcriptional regulator [Vitiosangium sp. GDMCC 1.1324]
MEETPQPRLGSRLRMARVRMDLTQEQVARSVGFVPAVYGRIERGDMVPSVPKLRELCLLLGVSADVLLSLGPPENAPSAPPPLDAPEASPELRRLTLLVRELPPDRLRLFQVALETIAAPDDEPDVG